MDRILINMLMSSLCSSWHFTFLLLPPSPCPVWFDSHPRSSLHGSPEHRPAAAAERSFARRQQYCEWWETSQSEGGKVTERAMMPSLVMSLFLSEKKCVVWVKYVCVDPADPCVAVCCVYSVGKRRYTWQPGQVRWRWSDVCWGTEQWWTPEHGCDYCYHFLL